MSKARAIADAFESDGDLKEAAADNITPRIGGAFVGTNGELNGATGSEDIFRIHTRHVNSQITIPAGNNAICAGPIELTANLIVEGTLTIV